MNDGIIRELLLWVKSKPLFFTLTEHPYKKLVLRETCANKTLNTNSNFWKATLKLCANLQNPYQKIMSKFQSLETYNPAGYPALIMTKP